jgi:hypothetical protein
MTIAHVRTQISNEQILSVHSVKDFEDYTYKKIASEFSGVVRNKMEIESTEDIERDVIDLHAKVVILSPQEYKDLYKKIEDLQMKLGEAIHSKYESRVPDNGGDWRDDEAYQRMTESEQRGYWGIFG